MWRYRFDTRVQSGRGQYDHGRAGASHRNASSDMPEEDGSRSSMKFSNHFSTFLRCCGEEVASAADSDHLPGLLIANEYRTIGTS
jgi:hypothetical protein